MPFEIIVTKKLDMAWDGGKATENLIPNDGDLVFDSTDGGTAIFKEVTGLKVEVSVIEFSPDQDNGLLLPAVQTGGVSVACGDVGGDNGALGDPVTSDENFVYGGPENADGHAGQKGAWVADVTYERDLINLTGVNGLDGDHGGSFDLVFPTQTGIIKEVTGLKVEVAVVDFSPDQDELGWATDDNRAATGGASYSDFTWEDNSGGELAVLHMDAPVPSDFFVI